MFKLVVMVFILTIFFSSVELVHLNGVEEERITYYPNELYTHLVNPYIGLVPSAEYRDFPYPHSMVYKVLTWRELEPAKGVYAFEEMEETYNLDQIGETGKKFIFRIVLDYSRSDVSQLDIPDWLYEEMRGDGIWYDTSVGKGFSPNYENPILLSNHEKLIKAFSEKYNNDPRLAYIALGSIGHWGEWHTYIGEDLHIPFPKIPTSDLYVKHYLNVFPNTKLLLRRPYPIVQEYGLGLYNDMFGHTEATNNYIEWFNSGYESQLAGTFIQAMPAFWLNGPSGGEFGFANHDGNYYKDENIEESIRQVKESHLSWVGPSSGLEDLNEEEKENFTRFLNTLGYRFVITSVSHPLQAKLGKGFSVFVKLTNKGVAPFYYEWPVVLKLVDGAGNQMAKMTSSQDIRTWTPGEITFKNDFVIPNDIKQGPYKILIGILDPSTNLPGIDFAIEGKRSDGYYEVGSIYIH